MFEDSDRPDVDVVQACVDRLAREAVLLRPAQWRVIRCESEPIELGVASDEVPVERVRITIDVEQRQEQVRAAVERHPEMEPRWPGINVARAPLRGGGRLVRNSPNGRSEDPPRGGSRPVGDR